MARQKLIHIHSVQLDKIPEIKSEQNPNGLEKGEIAINYLKNNEHMFIRNSEDEIVDFIPRKNEALKTDNREIIASINEIFDKVVIDSEVAAAGLTDLSTNKQNISDSDLTTTDKTIVGAINEIDGKLAGKSGTGHTHNDMATQTWVGQNYSETGHTHNDMATKTWVSEQGYLTDHQSLSDYAKTSWVNNNFASSNHDHDERYSLTGHTHSQYLTTSNLDGYATETWVEGKHYLTSHQSLDGYATQTWVGQNYSETGHTHDGVYLKLEGTTGETQTVKTNIKANGKISAPHFFQESDENLKDFKDDIKINLDSLKEIPKKYFTWKKDAANKPILEIGTSAQKVQKYFPELVSKNEDGNLTVEYSKLSIIALSAIDELNDENKKLKNRMNSLEKELNEIKKLLKK